MNKMKRVLLLLRCFALCLIPMVVNAQTDTLFGRVPYFHYNYYDSNWCKSQVNQEILYYTLPRNVTINSLGVERNHMVLYGYAMCVYGYQQEASEIAIQMDMDSAMMIKGIAFGYNYEEPECWHWVGGVPLIISNSNIYNTKNYIFNIYDVGMNILWSDTVATQDLRIDHYMEAGFHLTSEAWESSYRQWYSNSGEFQGYEAPGYIGLCYVMFDTSIYVPETFYIGVTSSTPINTLHDTALVITTFIECYPNAMIGYDSIWCFPYESRRYRVSQGGGEAINEWETEECHYGVQTCLYPILDLPCDDISGLRCESVGSAGVMAFVQWDANPRHAAYEVSYGPKDTPAGAGTVVTTTAPRFMNTIDRNTRYDFYVRARCDYDTTKWSAWSDTLHVHLATLDIQDAEAIEWSLMPNPAHGSATVQCGEEIMAVE